VNDLPLLTSSTTNYFSENLPVGTVVYNTTYFDEDVADTST
jgi:hypothetical protein